MRRALLLALLLVVGCDTPSGSRVYVTLTEVCVESAPSSAELGTAIECHRLLP